MYAIVEFLSTAESATQDISIVPYIWVIKNETKCYWPLSTNRLSFMEFVRRETPYKSNWPKYSVSRIHYKTDNYDEAEARLSSILASNEEAVFSSNNSTKSLNRKQITSAISTDSESDSEAQGNFSQNKNGPVSNQYIQNISHDSKIGTTIGRSPSSRNERNVAVMSPATTISVASDMSLSSSTAFENTVLLELARIKANVENQSQLLAEIVRHNRSYNTSKPPLECPDFPINSLEEFNAFNRNLSANSEIREYMVRRLAAVGGSGIEQLTRRILKFLLTNELARRFNWKGREKIAFEGTNVMAVIYDSAKLNFPQNERSDMSISRVVKDWLKLATARMAKSKPVDNTN